MAHEDTPLMKAVTKRLYRGPNFGDKTLGHILDDMAKRGQTIARSEMARVKENRDLYRGQQRTNVNLSADSLRSTLSGRYPYSRSQEEFNLLRPHVDARVAMLVKETPQFEVEPEDIDQDSIDGAKQAEKMLRSHWGDRGWQIKRRLAELALAAEIDGLAWLYVNWDPRLGPDSGAPVAVRMDGTPITDREEFEALKAQDPLMESLWKMQPPTEAQGDVTWKVLRMGEVSVDPLVSTDFDEARWVIVSRIRPRQEIEARAGASLKEMIERSKQTMGSSYALNASHDQPASTIDDGAGVSHRLSERDALLVHYAWIKPSNDWPEGAFVEWADEAPGDPLSVEPYPYQELPLRPYTPYPDGGHILRSLGTVDHLKPVQKHTNRTHVLLSEWLMRVARPPVGIPQGGLLSQEIYNDKGQFEFIPGLGTPVYFQAPAEPSNVLQGYLALMDSYAQKLSGVSDPARGFAPGHGVEAAKSLIHLTEQTEQAMGRTESEFKSNAIEWGCSRTLELVGRHYTEPRAVVGLGVDAAHEFQAFQGAMLRGAHRMRVKGSLLPRSKAAEMQTIYQFAPILGPDIKPYIGELMKGDVAGLNRSLERNRKRQRRENTKMAGVVKNELAFPIFENFEADKTAFNQAILLAQRQVQPRMSPMDPKTPENDVILFLQANGIVPPNLTDMMRSAGFDIPTPFRGQNHAIHLDELQDFRDGDGWDKLHPMVHQLVLEHENATLDLFGKDIGAMAHQMPMGGQQGSQPAEKGTPSPPKSDQPQNGMRTPS